ncbi:MAG TPA: sigma-70 family RNA polymerase sigma factor [Marmoricola sp.]
MIATEAAVTAAWRAESARLIATLVRLTGDVALAEDLAQDALVAALEQWPRDGIPASPGAWLTTTARRRAIDVFRRNEVARRHGSVLAHEHDPSEEDDMAGQVDHVEDDVLRLIFLCCHPSLTPDSRAALTLRLVAGLSTAEIARAFMVSAAAMGQRLTRAKRTLALERAEFEMPDLAARIDRLDDVLSVIYLIFNEGHTATAGNEWFRADLCHEAVRLARMVAAMLPGEPDAHALQALVELHAARLPARTDAHGVPVLLADQDRRRWDQLLTRRGFAALDRAEQLARGAKPVGSYFLQAAIAGVHMQARTADETDWTRIARLYDVLASTAPGPVVEVNRAVAHGRARGPEAGLEILAALPADALADSPVRPAVTGDLLLRAGRADEAATAFDRAAALTRNEAERAVLARRAEQARSHPRSSPQEES